ncbi:MAG: prolyl oligopeptidase family serine peptidase, partial [Chitinivibrionales bacterium]|nr:prolyl oligopeptidase family serine peptidase [Chitinivibrionales bacterium]
SYEEYAEEAFSGEHYITAGKFLTMAAIYYRFAEFLAIEEPDRKRIFEKMVPIYERAGKYFSPPHRVIEVKFEGYTIKGYLRHPYNAEKVPCLFSIGGIDGVKEEKAGPSEDAIGRNWAMLAFDLPGQGELRRLKGILPRPDFHKVISLFIDEMEKLPEIDGSRIVLVGGSAGGFFVLKGAAMDHRVRACVDLAGPFELKTLYEAPFPIPKTMEYAFDLSEDKIGEELEKYSLKECIKDIKCPVLILHGGEDITVPYSDAQRIYDGLECEKHFLYYEDGDHVCFNNFGNAIPRMLNWIEKRFRE